MTPAQIIDLIAKAIRDSRDFWQHDADKIADAQKIVNELVAAGLAVDDQTGENSLEARILVVTDRLYDRYEGADTPEANAASIAVALGLVTEDEAHGVLGEPVA